MFEIVGEFCTLSLFALNHAGGDFTIIPQKVTQLGDKVGILGKAFHQDLARAIKGGLGVLNAFFRVNVFCRLNLGIKGRVAKQTIGQRLQPGFAGNLCLGAALFLIRQIQIFKTCLGVGLVNRRFKLGGEFVLFADAFKHGGPAAFKFGQIPQAFFQRTQLGVIKPAGFFFAVAGDKRNGRTFIEHLDGGNDLFGTNRKFFGDTLRNWTHGFSLFCSYA